MAGRAAKSPARLTTLGHPEFFVFFAVDKEMMHRRVVETGLNAVGFQRLAEYFPLNALGQQDGENMLTADSSLLCERQP